MRYLFYLGHPAHFHLFKHAIAALKAKGHEVEILCKTKDLLEDLLLRARWPYTNILPQGRRQGAGGLMYGLAMKNLRMLKHCLRRRPDVMLGTSPEIAQVGWLLNIPALVLNEDDVAVVPLFARAAYPFAQAIVAPERCDLGKWAARGVRYPGYQKLAYLHPKRFTPERERVEGLYAGGERYFLLRFVALTAHHDAGVRGLDPALARQVIALLEPHGAVWISSERPLDEAFRRYQLAIDPGDIHHALAYASLFVSDSQSMTVESAMLGTPSVRVSDLAGRIGVLEELEHRYGLTFGVRPSEPEKLLGVLRHLLERQDLSEEWARRRNEMLGEKTDLTAFLVWFLHGFPNTFEAVRKNPACAAQFR